MHQDQSASTMVFQTEFSAPTWAFCHSRAVPDRSGAMRFAKV